MQDVHAGSHQDRVRTSRTSQVHGPEAMVRDLKGKVEGAILPLVTPGAATRVPRTPL